ncbi:MAG: DUF72 domain-containing protein [Deltaproteobacteria bacterium]|nr:MAG: DUF72 domain-containing protein [Deltaproteobacteria bacterium]
MLADARVGTTGFAYREWLGSVYPRGAAASQLLPMYAERLPAVEIVSTFSRLPNTEQLATWCASVPPGFQFALKAPARVSQDLALGKAGASFASFIEAVSELGDHLGPVLIQLPDQAQCDRRALSGFLQSVPDGLRLAFEFRHPSWHDDATLRLLSAHDAALVLTDAGEGPPRLEITASFTYVRIRREEGEAIDAWAERLALLTRRGIDVYAFLKHDRRGLAVDRAMRLSSLLRAGSELGEQALLS